MQQTTYLRFSCGRIYQMNLYLFRSTQLTFSKNNKHIVSVEQNNWNETPEPNISYIW